MKELIWKPITKPDGELTDLEYAVKKDNCKNCNGVRTIVRSWPGDPKKPANVKVWCPYCIVTRQIKKKDLNLEQIKRDLNESSKASESSV